MICVRAHLERRRSFFTAGLTSNRDCKFYICIGRLSIQCVTTSAIFDFVSFLKFPQHGPYTVLQINMLLPSLKLLCWNVEQFSCFCFPILNIILGSSLILLRSQFVSVLQFELRSFLSFQLWNSKHYFQSFDYCYPLIHFMTGPARLAGQTITYIFVNQVTTSWLPQESSITESYFMARNPKQAFGFIG